MRDDDLTEMELESGGDDWNPTPHGMFLGEVIASGDLIAGKDVLELGAGLGNHTILLARKGARSVVATEITKARADTARRNVARNCPDYTAIDFAVADWTSVEGQYDLVVANPPFAKSGRRNRRYFIDALILEASKRLRDDGALLFVQSSMANIDKSLRRLDENGYDASILERRTGRFRDYYFDDEAFMDEIRSVPNGFELRDGVHYETLFVIHARLRAWTPHAAAH